jgi:hypothetical protein
MTTYSYFEARKRLSTLLERALTHLSTIFRRVYELFWHWYPLRKLADGEKPLTDTALLRSGLTNCRYSFTSSNKCK